MWNQKKDSDVATAIKTIVFLIFVWIVFKEKLSKKAALGLVCIVAGTLLLVVI